MNRAKKYIFRALMTCVVTTTFVLTVPAILCLLLAMLLLVPPFVFVGLAACMLFSTTILRSVAEAINEAREADRNGGRV
jgi:cobalamin biosynthesis protein CobD/CbiB